MDSWRTEKKQNIPSNGRLLTSRAPNVRHHRPMHQKLPGDTSPENEVLHIIGISVSKLRDQSLENYVQQKASMTQNGGSDSHVTAAQTSGWRLKPVPAHGVPVICSYSRPLHITLCGRPLIASSTQAQHFVRHFGRTLLPADSRSWWNYRFATYTILSRNPKKMQQSSHHMVGRETHSNSHLRRQEGTAHVKSLPTEASIQGPQDINTTDTKEFKKDPYHPDPGGARKRVRKQKSGPPGGSSRHVLSIPPSHTESKSRIHGKDSGAQVMSPEPWPSAHTPDEEEEEISITVPLLPKMHQPGQ